MASLKRILIVDDDETVLFVLCHALAKLGCEIQVATSGYDALQAIAEGEFDLLVTDIRLPGPDGIRLTEALRTRAPAAPAIWITAHHDPGLPALARQLGVYRCLAKPIEIEEIRAVVQEALGATGAPAP